ncbi:MAG: hypothetical protein GDA56_03600 [Hormoscilla sp. GM7CHS1pb]|nr:hypothetical protein [Hormoscilla sp. GM7CHS1pb]
MKQGFSGHNINISSIATVETRFPINRCPRTYIARSGNLNLSTKTWRNQIMFGQGYLVKKGVEYTGEALGMDKKDAKMLGQAAMLVTTIATLDFV